MIRTSSLLPSIVYATALVVSPSLMAQLKLPWETDKKPPAQPPGPNTATPAARPTNTAAPAPPVTAAMDAAARKELVEKFFSAISRGDQNTALTLMSRAYRNDVSAASFAAFVRFWIILREHQSHQLRELSSSTGTTAALRASVRTAEDSGIDAVFKLANDEGRWAIDSIVIVFPGQDGPFQQGCTPAVAEAGSGSGRASLATSASGIPAWTDVLTRPLNDNELAAMPLDSLKLLRNEVFARHGYEFKSEALRKHFGTQPWYSPVTTDQGSIGAALSVLEQENMKLIVAEEERRR